MGENLSLEGRRAQEGTAKDLRIVIYVGAISVLWVRTVVYSG